MTTVSRPTPDAAVRVARLGTVPVKGARWRASDALRLEEDGPLGDRTFFVIDPDGKLLRTSRVTKLTRIRAAYDDDTLSLTLPDGSEISEPVVLGRRAETHNYEGREIPGRLVEGSFAAALSRFLGRPVALLARDRGVFGADDAPVSLMFAETVAALAPELAGTVPDERRFRMNITLVGAEAWTEHAWGGAELELGDARLRVISPIPRCVVTTRDPDTGTRDLPAVRAITNIRGRRDTGLGVWCEVVRPGTVRCGDVVTVHR